ncbi:hypothetical protein Tco_1008248 [Tanacetum coccineum]
MWARPGCGCWGWAGVRMHRIRRRAAGLRLLVAWRGYAYPGLGGRVCLAGRGASGGGAGTRRACLRVQFWLLEQLWFVRGGAWLSGGVGGELGTAEEAGPGFED